jgi:hypothetical protein
MLVPNGKRGRYRTNHPDLVDRTVDAVDRISKLERTPQGATSPGISSVQYSEVMPSNPFDTIVSTSFGDLLDGFGGGTAGTPGPIVTDVMIGATGIALVTLTAYMEVPDSHVGAMGVEITGPTNMVAVEKWSLRIGGDTSSAGRQMSCIVPISGLAIGNYTFTAKYRSEAGTTIRVGYRNMIVQPT